MRVIFRSKRIDNIKNGTSYKNNNSILSHCQRALGRNHSVVAMHLCQTKKQDQPIVSITRFFTMLVSFSAFFFYFSFLFFHSWKEKKPYRRSITVSEKPEKRTIHVCRICNKNFLRWHFVWKWFGDGKSGQPITVEQRSNFMVVEKNYTVFTRNIWFRQRSGDTSFHFTNGAHKYRRMYMPTLTNSQQTWVLCMRLLKTSRMGIPYSVKSSTMDSKKEIPTNWRIKGNMEWPNTLMGK